MLKSYICSNLLSNFPSNCFTFQIYNCLDYFTLFKTNSLIFGIICKIFSTIFFLLPPIKYTTILPSLITYYIVRIKWAFLLFMLVINYTYHNLPSNTFNYFNFETKYCIFWYLFNEYKLVPLIIPTFIFNCSISSVGNLKILQIRIISDSCVIT
jgi:hypothetical protein